MGLVGEFLNQPEDIQQSTLALLYSKVRDSFGETVADLMLDKITEALENGRLVDSGVDNDRDVVRCGGSSVPSGNEVEKGVGDVDAKPGSDPVHGHDSGPRDDKDKPPYSAGDGPD